MTQTTEDFYVTTLDHRPQGPSRITDVPVPTGRPVGWFDDPRGSHDQRFYDGVLWTDHVTHFGPEPCTGCGPQIT